MVLKIKPSTMQVKQSRPVNVAQLAIPISFAQQIGANVSAAGKEFEKIKKEQKLIEDQNRFYELVGAQQKIIDKGLFEASQMNNLEMAETSLAKAYEIDVSSENKKSPYPS